MYRGRCHGRRHTLLLVQVVLLGDIAGDGLGRPVCFGVDGGHWLLEVGVELGLEGLQLLEAVLRGCLDGFGLGGKKSS
jgi:hypothetical protein